MSRTIKSSERITIQTVSKILGVTDERAAHLCETGVFPSAEKICGSCWAVDKNEVLEYKRLAGKEYVPETENEKGWGKTEGERRNSAIGERLAPFLGKISDTAAARLTGVSRQTVMRHRKKTGISNIRILCKWEDFDALLGKVPDKEVAKRAGCSLTAVYYRRKKLNIPSFDKWETLDSLLRTMSDAEVAEELGCSLETVRKRRKLYKMPAPRKPALRQGQESADDARPERKITYKTTNELDARLANCLTLDMLIAMRENGENPP